MAVFRTGAYKLDHKLGGGFPQGVLEIWGEENTGKSTFALSFLREAERRGMLTGLIHLDGMVDTNWCWRVGAERTVVPFLDSGEQAIEVAVSMLKHGVRVLVIDTLVGMIPKSVEDTPLYQSVWNAQRKLLTHGLRILARTAFKYSALVIVLNQVRHTIIDGRKAFLHATTSSLVNHRLYMWKQSATTVYGGLDRTEVMVELEFIKRKLVEVDQQVTLWPRHGVWPEMELLEFLALQEVLVRKGNWWTTPLFEKSIGPGFKGAAKHIASYYDAYYELMEEVING
mgnify:CR=1 FL=1